VVFYLSLHLSLVFSLSLSLSLPRALSHCFLGVTANTSSTFWVRDWVIISDLSGMVLEVFADILCILEARDRLVFGHGGPGAAVQKEREREREWEDTSVREGYG
jgi:hypothetical protein